MCDHQREGNFRLGSQEQLKAGSRTLLLSNHEDLMALVKRVARHWPIENLTWPCIKSRWNFPVRNSMSIKLWICLSILDRWLHRLKWQVMTRWLVTNLISQYTAPDSKVHWANIGATQVLSVPRWAPYWSHEPCYLGNVSIALYSARFVDFFVICFVMIMLSVTGQFNSHIFLGVPLLLLRHL